MVNNVNERFQSTIGLYSASTACVYNKFKDEVLGEDQEDDDKHERDI